MNQPFDMPDGRYEGSGDGLFLQLRVESAGPGPGVVSGDLFLAGAEPRRHLVSFRSGPGPVPTAVTCESSDGRVTTGRLELTPAAGRRITATLRLDRQLNALPAGDPVTVVAGWVAGQFRVLHVETEVEAGVVVPDAANDTLRDCLRTAGLEMVDQDPGSLIPARGGGWDWHEGNMYGVLDVLMEQQASGLVIDAPGWEVQLLMLSRSTTPGLYGVMFDVAGVYPRQGCAVFVDEIRERFADDKEDQRIMATMAHEVGHALNLAHRFERPVGRADSISPMNYASRYRGGRRDDEYWDRFRYTFDPDELAFLRHGARAAVMPGASAFHSADYWSGAPGAKPSYLPSTPHPGLRLTLRGPGSVPEFAFGQPVQLEVRLENTGDRPWLLPARLLDVKSGYLEILIERTRGSNQPGSFGTQASFQPWMQRCLTGVAEVLTAFAPGLVRSSNVNLTFGASGFPLADPGEYRITPLVTVPDRDERGYALVVLGEALTVRVGFPADDLDLRHGNALLRPDVGRWNTLGGTDRLPDVEGRIAAIRDERLAARGATDPIAVALTRTLAIHRSRAYLHLDDKKTDFEVRPSRLDDARRMLDDLVSTDGALACFDPWTAQDTRALAQDLHRPGR